MMQRSKGIILSILVASLFLPLLAVPNDISAQEKIGNEIRGSGTTNNTTSGTPACVVDSIASGEVVEVNKSKVGTSEKFDLYVKMEISKTQAELCEQFGTNTYAFSPYFYYGTSISGQYVNYKRSYEAKYFNEGGKYGFQALIKDIDVKDYAKDSSRPYQSTYYIYVYYHRQDQSDDNAPYLKKYATVNHDEASTSGNPVISPFPSFTPPPAILTTGSKLLSSNDKVVSASSLGVKFLGIDGKGIRTKYRMAMTDTAPMVFGSSGLDAIGLDWGDGKPKLIKDQYVSLTRENDSSGIINQHPQYKYTNIAFTYADSKWDGKKACQGAYVANETCDILFYYASTSNKDKGNWDEDARNKILTSNPISLNPSLNPIAWKKFDGKKSVDGQPVGKVEFLAVPMIWAVGSLSGAGSVYIMGTNPAKFTIEVYEDEKQIIEACKKENSGDEAKCTAAYSRYGIGKLTEQSTDSSDTDADDTLAGDLFNFIAKIIAYIVLLITSFVYWVFAFILVPVLVALTGVHPYKDTFVNFIYPGWIIIRNISNIVFIVALLYMGLKILFQQEDSAKSRGFIITLILMALLVNFSLAIGQSIVAIADTVQAQFLPADSKVIESLAQKLMTEPIKTFRGGDDSLTSSGNFEVDKAASDIPKAIVLLVLALAAFFCFVALIAFMFVRLVALWILFMLSPLAYVGRILPETKSYANKWWTEFIRYSFNVPIMVFFLNIAALIAVTFSQQSGDQVQSAAADGKLLGSTAKELTEFALTIVSHFVVLIFIFIGMKFAQKFGGVGAEKIVGFAKKGFDAVTKKPAQWAGGAIKNMAKEQYERKIAGGLMDPKAWKQGWKDRIAKATDKKKTARLLKKDGKLNPEIATGNILKSAKYLFHKATGGAPHRLLNEADSLKEQAGILTQGERLGKEDRLATDSSVKDIYDNFSRQIPETGPINTAATLADIDTRINDFQNQGILKADALEVEANNLEATGNISGAEAKRQERDTVLDEYQERALKLNAIRDKLDPAVNGGVDVNSDPGLRKEIASALAKEVKEFEKSIKDTETRLTQNDTAKAKYGVTGDMPEDERKRLMDQAEKLEQKASERKLPESMAIKALLREGQKKEMEKYDGIDDPDELIAIHKKAMKDNNLLLATAIQKKLAKEGFFKDLLQDGGKKNNIESMQAFFAENLKGMAPNLRMQVMSEVSFLNKQNGNLALANATKIDPNTGALRASTLDEQAKKVNGFLESRNPNDLKNLKGDQIVREREDGKNEMFEGYITGMRKHMESLTNLEFNKFVPGIPTAVAKKVVNSVNFGSFNPQNTPIGARTQAAFRTRAGV